MHLDVSHSASGHHTVEVSGAVYMKLNRHVQDTK